MKVPDGAGMRHELALSGTAFLLHFVWESVQCPIFFVHHAATWRGMGWAALGDVVLTWAVYGAVAIGFAVARRLRRREVGDR